MKILPILVSALLLSRAVQAETGNDDERIAIALNRITFGARPGDIEKVRSLGVDKFIEAQLNPASLAESKVVLAQLQKSPALTASSSKLVSQFVMEKKRLKAAKRQLGEGGENGAAGDSNPKTAAGESAREDGNLTKAQRAKVLGREGSMRNDVSLQVIQAKLLRATQSPRQLQELMTDFWFNHFNIAMSKGIDRVLIGAYEEQAIRPNSMGKFRDLLGATMHHPAMMFYLDNAQNTKDGFQSFNPKNKKRGINENYARELLELHTLGVDGGYSQKDVMELARVLTGWGMPGLRASASGSGGYWASFEDRRHDFGDKVVLGQRIKGSGPKEIEEVLDNLCKHPSTAKHISYQLAQYFVADNPPQELVDRLTQRFTQTNGDIKLVLSTLFQSPEFWDAKYQNAKFKSPFRYTVSAFRATGVFIDDPRKVQAFLKVQGQPLYGCLTPDGYKNTKEAWLNPDGLLKRLDFASLLALYQRRQGVADYEAVVSTVNGGKLSEKTQQAIAKAPDYQKIAALIGSPEFMNY